MGSVQIEIATRKERELAMTRTVARRRRECKREGMVSRQYGMAGSSD